ncbi:MAG: hypothetical protein JWP85_2137 [Rhodoglobus sp.]|nr:hypothetical protein [Rhodoglobus sp.]
MNDRVVAVSLTMQVANYIAGAEQVRRSNLTMMSSAERARAKFEEQNQAMTRVGTGLVAVGALAAVGVGLAIKTFADFDAAISKVEAATHGSANEMDRLRAAALEAGARTVFSAIESANAIEELAKAGLTATEILAGGLDAALDLAAASGIGVAEAAGIAATALKVFKLEGKDMSHVADLMAAAAGKAMGGVTEMGQALSQAAQVAKSTGLTIDETTTALAAFASQGLLGSDAGTSFKSMLQRLTPQSTEAAARMKDLGISAYDQQGKFVGLEKFAGILRAGLEDLTAEQRNSALATIFGSDAVRAATVLYSEGSDGIRDWSEKVNDAGYAAETARIRLDNLNGDVEKLSGSFDTALIKSGSAADGTLRLLVQTATELVDIFNGAPPIVQQATLALGALVAVGGLTAGTFLLAVPRIAEFTTALITLSTSPIPAVRTAALRAGAAITVMSGAMSKSAAFLSGPWGLALAAASIGVALLSKYLDDLQASSAEITNSLTTATSAADLFHVALKGKDVKWWANTENALANLDKHLQLSAEEAGNLWARFNNDTEQNATIEALADIGTELGALAGSDLPAAQRSFRLLADETDGTDRRLWQLLSTMPGYKDALIEQAGALGINVTSTNEAANKAALLKLAFGNATPTALDAADAYLAAADEASGLNDQMRSLMDAINEANGIGQDAVSQNAAYQESLAGISAEVQSQKDAFIQLQKDGYEAANGTLEGFVGTLDGFSLSLDESTAAGSANAAMLSQVAADAQSAALAQYEVDKTTMSAKDATDKYILTLGTSRQSLIDQALANGYSAEEVQKLIDKVYAMPTQRETKLLVDKANAQQQIDSFVNDNTGRTIAINVANSRNFADGGPITGIGGPRQDNIPIMASAGEHMWSARDVQAAGGHDAVFAIRRSLYQGLADGGPVKPMYAHHTFSAPPQYATESRGRGDVNVSLTTHNPVRKSESETIREAGQIVSVFL